MTGYLSNTTPAQIAAALAQAQRVVVTTHAKPDGDAFGAVIALAQALERKGKAVERWIMPPLPIDLKVINGPVAPVHFHGSDADPLPQGEPDAIVVLDTGSWSQLAPMRTWLEPRCDRITLIDHHLYGDVPAPRRWVDTAAAATCEMVADLIDLLGRPLDMVIANALYVGLASDTGWFRFSNTTPRVHMLAARLLALGVDHAALYQKLEQSERMEKLLLSIRALESLQLLGGGKVALMTLRRSDFATTGARQEETERVVDLPQVVKDIRLVALLTEVDAKAVRVSFRSKPGPGAIDVNVLAQQFGGGGHARAAGARINQPLKAVHSRLVAALIQAVNAPPEPAE
jgi:bifunctional oligoribonuclease and PAP phosphatase NrnA